MIILDERVSFLKKFYEYCKENGDSFNVKWGEWKKAVDAKSSAAFPVNPILKNTSSYMKNSVTPTFLYVISQNSILDNGKLLRIGSLL